LVEASKNGLERIITAVDRLKSLSPADGEVDSEVNKSLSEYVQKFDAAMDDDLNTADAISVIFELVKYMNVNITEESTSGTVAAALDTVNKLCDVLGIITEKEQELLDADIEALIEERQAARKAKNFARADEIRNQLQDMGIILEDTREGVKWKRA
jgi:cysteinyl-tRNA synthetase